MKAFLAMDQNRCHVETQMSGCLEPGTKTTTARRVGNPRSQDHGYGSSSQVAMALQIGGLMHLAPRQRYHSRKIQ
jgi:hypothetical protein